MSETVKLVTTEALRVGRRLAAEEMRERAKQRIMDYEFDDAGWPVPGMLREQLAAAIAALPVEEERG